MQKLYKRKMASQITLYVSMLLAVALAIVITILFNVTTDIVQRESYEKVYYMTTYASDEFDTSLKNVVDVGESIENIVRESYSHQGLATYSEGYLDGLIDSYVPKIKMIAQEFSISKTAYVYFNPELDGTTHDVYFVDENGDGTVGRQEELPLSYFVEDESERGANDWWFGPINAHKGYWTAPYSWTFDDGTKRHFVSYTRPVFIENKLVAVIGTDFEYEKMIEEILEIKVYDTGYTFLINDLNRFLIHPKYEKGTHIDGVGDPIFTNLYEDLIYNDSNILDDIISENAEFLVSYERLSNDWVFGIVVPKKEIYKEMSKLYWTLIVMVTLIVPILGFAIYYIASHISRPIVEMTEVVYRIKNGNYHLEISERSLDRDDEIGILAHAINEMRIGLIDGFKKITNQNMQLKKEMGDRIQFQEQFEIVHKAFSKARDGLFITDSSFNVLYANESMTRITGYNKIQIVNHPLSKTIRVKEKNIWSELVEKGSWSGELELKDKNNGVVALNFTISCVEEDEENKYIGILEDITQSKRQAEDIDYLKRFDSLTGLPNKDQFLEAIKHSIGSEEENQEIGVLALINIDDFRLVNQAIGFNEANKLIVELGRRLRDTLGERDLIARMTGDEFGVFIQEMDHLNDIENSIQSIIDTINAPLSHENKELYMTVSIGVSIFPFDANNENDLYAFANSALSYAKGKGKNNFQYYSREMTKDAFEKYELTNSLRQALDDDQFYIDYQPQYHLANQKIIGAEALIRWKHPDKGIISPIKFIPLAEGSGFINNLGEWVLRKACLDIKRMHENGMKEFAISVNLSSVQLLKPDFVITLKSIIDEIGFNPCKLEIEITESIFMSSSHQVIENLTRIKDMGVRISIDDFGTGFSSLAYLKNFKVDKLKIDRSFVKDIPENDDGNIAKLVINLAESLGIEVIAEGTETVEQVNFMLENGCNQIQGYYFSKPISLIELNKLVKRTNKK